MLQETATEPKRDKIKRQMKKDRGEGNDGGSKMIPINNPQY
jgi:hypothetical protein